MAIKNIKRQKRAKKTRSKIELSENNRLTVFRFNAHIYAQISSFDGSKIIASASTAEASLKGENNGNTHTIDIANGLSVMEGAVQNDIPGIDADCGGGMACATCHVYVKEEWWDKVPKKEDGEEDMLDMAYEPNQFSRLSCQVIISDELDGLTVSIPSKQG